MALGWSLCCWMAKPRLLGTPVAGHRVTVPMLPLPLPSCALSDSYCDYKYLNRADLRDGLVGPSPPTGRLPEV